MQTVYFQEKYSIQIDLEIYLNLLMIELFYLQYYLYILEK